MRLRGAHVSWYAYGMCAPLVRLVFMERGVVACGSIVWLD